MNDNDTTNDAEHDPVAIAAYYCLVKLFIRLAEMPKENCRALADEHLLYFPASLGDGTYDDNNRIDGLSALRKLVQPLIAKSPNAFAIWCGKIWREMLTNDCEEMVRGEMPEDADLLDYESFLGEPTPDVSANLLLETLDEDEPKDDGE